MEIDLKEKALLESIYHQINTDSEMEDLTIYPRLLLQKAILGGLLVKLGSSIVDANSEAKLGEIRNHPIFLDLHARAPVSTRDRMQLWSGLKDIHNSAKAKGYTLDASSREDVIGEHHFELGCWLHHYRFKVSGLQEISILDRIDCLRRIIGAGFNEINDDSFLVVFGFGQRAFDGIFEMGDSHQIQNWLRPLAAAHPTEAYGKFFEHIGWSIRPEAPVVNVVIPDSQSVKDLRNEGYAVVIFGPDELEGANPVHLQNRLVELGNEVIGDLPH